MTLSNDYRSRASTARQEADATKLENVRRTLLRSADAWDQMAQREERVAAVRKARAEDKQTNE